ncbi:MAG TPA: alpha/beta hydrolase [Sedimentisphaerales bacterium]|nr:alpha/beta hydrolase [Sedimentisphaerales bacterium]
MSGRSKTILCLGFVTTLCLCPLAAAQPKVELLWPDGAPGAKGQAEGDKPTLTIYLPPQDKATGAAVVICPGGGYGHLAMDHEGHQIGQWLNSFGVAGFIVSYRHTRSGAGYNHPAPIQDAQRAIQTVRSRAREWGVDPDRIGILGFSAGGHLASTAATHFNESFVEPRDAIDRASRRPDFAVLVYPVIAFGEPFTHYGSQHNLLGRDADKAMVEKFSNEKQVTPQTPPTFLFHTWEDTAVPPENSIMFYLALRKAKVPAEMHVFLKGQHGIGLGQNRGAASAWPGLCQKWMEESGLLKGTTQ